MKPISLQLYTLREASKQDFVDVIKKVAKIGYVGVEPAGFYNLSPKEFRSVVEAEGMVISSSHGPWAKEDNVQEVIDTAGVLGVDLVAGGYGPEFFKDLDAVKKTADVVNGIQEALAKAGLSLFLHNHYWEFAKMPDGRLAYDHFAELAPKVLFELDTYWSSNFGQNDPAQQVKKFKARTPLLHIKDGPQVKDQPHVAVGAGTMDIPAVIDAADDSVLRWLIVELDHCATDMLTAVAESYTFLIENELAQGRV